MKRQLFRWFGLAVAVGAVLLPLLHVPLSETPAMGSGANVVAHQAPAPGDALVLVLGDRASIDSALTRLGGGIDYALADGTLAAHLPASRASELARASGVSRVIPDGGV